jgi:gas vesicle protein
VISLKEERAMRKMTLLFGIATGAGIMYLLDPQHGRERREKLGALLGQARRKVRERLERSDVNLAEAPKEAFQTVKSRARSVIEEAEGAISGALRRNESGEGEA